MPSRKADVGPGITVEKIELRPIPPPVEIPPGKPLTEKEVGARVRLLHNMITAGPEGKSVLIPRGEIVDLETVPERWRTAEYIEGPEEFRRDKVQLLHDMTFAMPSFDGDRTVWRERLFSAYSLVDLKTFPNRIVEGMIEGEDYLSQWDESDRQQKEFERQNATEEFSMGGPEIPDDVSSGRKPHDRYRPDSL